MPKKLAKKPAARLPASKTFTAVGLSRREIASALNNAIEGSRSTLRRFKPDDPRLTDNVCEAYVWSINDHMTQDSFEQLLEEAQKDVACDVLEEFEDELEGKASRSSLSDTPLIDKRPRSRR